MSVFIVSIFGLYFILLISHSFNFFVFQVSDESLRHGDTARIFAL